MRRGRAALAILFLLVLPCAALACGLGVTGVDVSGVEADGGILTADASSDSHNNALIDSPSDGLADDDVVDASADAVVDAANDVTTGVDANTRWCLTASHRLCADFDDNTFAGGVIETSSNGQVALTTNAFAGGLSMAASVGLGDSSNRARINFPSLAVLSSTLRFQAMFRVDAVATSGGLTYLFTIQETDANVYGVRLAIDANSNLGVALTGPGAPQPAILGPIPTTWFLAVIDMSPNQVVVRIDNGAPQTFAWNATPPPNILLKLGIVGANGVSSSIRIDNVSLD